MTAKGQKWVSVSWYGTGFSLGQGPWNTASRGKEEKNWAARCKTPTALNRRHRSGELQPPSTLRPFSAGTHTSPFPRRLILCGVQVATIAIMAAWRGFQSWSHVERFANDSHNEAFLDVLDEGRRTSSEGGCDQSECREEMTCVPDAAWQQLVAAKVRLCLPISLSQRDFFEVRSDLLHTQHGAPHCTGADTRGGRTQTSAGAVRADAGGSKNGK